MLQISNVLCYMKQMTENWKTHWKNTVTYFVPPEQNTPEAQDLWEVLART